MRRSYSLSDLSDQGLDGNTETDSGEIIITDTRLLRHRRSPHKSAASSTSPIYFSEVDVRQDTIARIHSIEDISSGYSSGEGVYSGQLPKLQAREGLVRSGSIGPGKTRVTRVTRSTGLSRKTASIEVIIYI